MHILSVLKVVLNIFFNNLYELHSFVSALIIIYKINGQNSATLISGKQENKMHKHHAIQYINILNILRFHSCIQTECIYRLF